MKGDSRNETGVVRIRQLLKGIGPAARNSADQVYINIIKNEFIVFDKKIAIPSIAVKELDYETASEITALAADIIPEFLVTHDLLADRVPPSEQHSIQFVKRLSGRCLDFVHMFKLDLRFGGGAADFIDPGNSNFYPSYYTDRFYYKSRLIPVMKEVGQDGPEGFSAVRLVDSTYTESDQYFHTFAIFEDVNYKEITMEIHGKLGLPGVFPISLGLYPFVEYDYFTACLNVVKPSPGELEKALAVFEPLFLVICGRYRRLDGLVAPGAVTDTFAGILSGEGNAMRFTEEFLPAVKDYFSRFSLYRDDELALKGWWRLDCAE